MASRTSAATRTGATGSGASRECDGAEVPADSDAVSHIGAYLAQQRQLRGISQEELCHLTHIPLRSLQRLEEGAFDDVDDGFVRGFVRTVAGSLGLDESDTLSRMSNEPEAGEVGASIAISIARTFVLGVCLLVVLGSVGLVSVALQSSPKQQEPQLTVRRDLVGALARAHLDVKDVKLQDLDLLPPLNRDGGSTSDLVAGEVGRPSVELRGESGESGENSENGERTGAGGSGPETTAWHEPLDSEN